MNLPNLFFVDFDGTLFQREAFWNAVKNTCATQFGISHAHFNTTYQQSKNRQTGYDTNAHLALLGITHVDLTNVCASLFAQSSFAYPDISAFLQNHSDDTVVILTEGVEWFQKVKIASLPREWDDVRIVVIQYKKRLYIEERIGFYEDGILFEGNHYKSLTFVDNKADAFLPEEHGTVFRQYRIKRQENPDSSTPTPRGITEITTLNEI